MKLFQAKIVAIFYIFLVATTAWSFQDLQVPWSVLNFKTYVPEHGIVEVEITTNYEKSLSEKELWEWAGKIQQIKSITIKNKGKFINVPKEAFQDLHEPLPSSFEIRHVAESRPNSGGFSVNFSYNPHEYNENKGEDYASLIIHGGKVVARVISPWSPSTSNNPINKCFSTKYPFKILCGLSLGSKTEQAEYALYSLKTGCFWYFKQNGQYPTNEQGLKALFYKPTEEPVPSKWKGPYFELSPENFPYRTTRYNPPLDPWGNEFLYSSNDAGFEIISLGADGKTGGLGENKDISSNGI